MKNKDYIEVGWRDAIYLFLIILIVTTSVIHIERVNDKCAKNCTPYQNFSGDSYPDFNFTPQCQPKTQGDIDGQITQGKD